MNEQGDDDRRADADRDADWDVAPRYRDPDLRTALRVTAEDVRNYVSATFGGARDAEARAAGDRAAEEENDRRGKLNDRAEEVESTAEAVDHAHDAVERAASSDATRGAGRDGAGGEEAGRREELAHRHEQHPAAGVDDDGTTGAGRDRSW